MSSSECITSSKYFVDPYLNCGVIRGPKKDNFQYENSPKKLVCKNKKTNEISGYSGVLGINR